MLTLFHTARSNRDLFDALLKEIAPDLPAQHIVDEAILREAREAGAVTDSIVARVAEAFATLSDASFILCTCSTIGGLAEQVSDHVLRVDRPMAERAVSLGSRTSCGALRILVAVTLQSTLEPTKALLMDAARSAKHTVNLTELCIDTAWPFFERNDHAGYITEIARGVEVACVSGAFDVIVLAQASMHEAEALCAHLPVPVLSSPRLGLASALRAVHAYRR